MTHSRRSRSRIIFTDSKAAADALKAETAAQYADSDTPHEFRSFYNEKYQSWTLEIYRVHTPKTWGKGNKS